MKKMWADLMLRLKSGLGETKKAIRAQSNFCPFIFAPTTPWTAAVR